MIVTKKINQFDGLELKEATFNNKEFPTHFHDSYSIGIITNGIENISVNGNNLIATPKSIVIINQNELHSNHYYNEQNWTYKTLNINSDVLAYFTNKKKELKFQNLIEDENLYNLLSDFHSTFHINIDEKLKTIAHYITCNHLDNKKIEENIELEWKIIIEEVKTWMQENIDCKILIENIAKKYKKSAFQFIRAFKKQTGLTPISYLLLLRLNKAKNALINGDDLVETALNCGFFDQSHFSHYFKKYFGISPKLYQKNCTFIS